MSDDDRDVENNEERLIELGDEDAEETAEGELEDGVLSLDKMAEEEEEEELDVESYDDVDNF